MGDVRKLVVASVKGWALPLLLPAAVLFVLGGILAFLGLAVATMVGGVKRS